MLQRTPGKECQWILLGRELKPIKSSIEPPCLLQYSEKHKWSNSSKIS